MVLSTEQKYLLSQYSSKRQDFLFAIQMLAPSQDGVVRLAIQCSYGIPDDLTAYQAAQDVITCANSPVSNTTGYNWIKEANCY